MQRDVGRKKTQSEPTPALLGAPVGGAPVQL